MKLSLGLIGAMKLEQCTSQSPPEIRSGETRVVHVWIQAQGTLQCCDGGYRLCLGETGQSPHCRRSCFPSGNRAQPGSQVGRLRQTVGPRHPLSQFVKGLGVGRVGMKRFPPHFLTLGILPLPHEPSAKQE